jgi:hypothetical protein
VNGSVPLELFWELAVDAVAPAAEVEVGVVEEEVGVAEAEAELGVTPLPLALDAAPAAARDDEGPEPLGEDVAGVVDGCAVLVPVEPLSGSTYCWSPAEVPVPWASALEPGTTPAPKALSTSETVTSAGGRPRISRKRPNRWN